MFAHACAALQLAVTDSSWSCYALWWNEKRVLALGADCQIPQTMWRFEMQRGLRATHSVNGEIVLYQQDTKEYLNQRGT